MDELRLIEPTEAYAGDIWALRQELLDARDRDGLAGCGSLPDCASAGEWIEDIRRNGDAQNPPEGRVPSSIYIAVRTRDDRIVGVIDLRHHIRHPILSTWGGHIGYCVRPAERGKGYARQMLRLNLDNARRRGLKRVLVTCDAENIPSERTILGNGGAFEKEIEVDGRSIKRYWIEL